MTSDVDPDLDRVFDLAARGWYASEIGTHLDLEVETVERLIEQAYKLLDRPRPEVPTLADSMELRMLACVNGLLRECHRFELDQRVIAGSLSDYAKACDIACRLAKQFAGVGKRQVGAASRNVSTGVSHTPASRMTVT
jgi:hypothetical protein